MNESLAKAMVFLLVGLGILFYSAYSVIRVEMNTVVPSFSDLKEVSAYVDCASQITEETTRRRQTTYRDVYYELDVSLADGSKQVWRVPQFVSEDLIRNVIQENVKGYIDVSDNNLVYQIMIDNDELISYQSIANVFIGEAQNSREIATSKFVLGFGCFMTFVGAVWLFVIWVRTKKSRPLS